MYLALSVWTDMHIDCSVFVKHSALLLFTVTQLCTVAKLVLWSQMPSIETGYCKNLGAFW